MSDLCDALVLHCSLCTIVDDHSNVTCAVIGVVVVYWRHIVASWCAGFSDAHVVIVVRLNSCAGCSLCLLLVFHDYCVECCSTAYCTCCFTFCKFDFYDAILCVRLCYLIHFLHVQRIPE